MTVSIVECQFFQVCIFYLFPHIHIVMQYGFFFLITDNNPKNRLIGHARSNTHHPDRFQEWCCLGGASGQGSGASSFGGGIGRRIPTVWRCLAVMVLGRQHIHVICWRFAPPRLVAIGGCAALFGDLGRQWRVGKTTRQPT